MPEGSYFLLFVEIPVEKGSASVPASVPAGVMKPSVPVASLGVKGEPFLGNLRFARVNSTLSWSIVD